jgi:hypothetical protein
MPATNTYDAIQSYTLTSPSNSITFGSIPQTYTDLILVVQAKGSASTGSNPVFQVNGDNGANYSFTFLSGDGTSAASGRVANNSSAVLGMRNSNLTNSDFRYNSITHFMNYSNTTTHKTIISRSNDAGQLTEFCTNLWRSTAAITSINCIIGTVNYVAGSTFSLYGIKAA